MSRPKTRTGDIADLLFAALIFGAVFIVHARWIYTHFSNDGYLLDSGWLAYLFGSADPLLRNPSAVNNLSFYAHHLSPHIFLFGAPLARLFGLSGIRILAYHQGLFFGLFFVSLYVMVRSANLPWRYRAVALAVAVVVGTLSNALFQAAAYPHYEIAMTAVASLALAACVGGHAWLFILCLVWLPLIREDGGFYAAFACLACLATDNGPHLRLNGRTRRLLAIAAAGIVISVCFSLLQARLFPGFDAFSSNFSGSSWDHLSSGFLAGRFRAMLLNLNTVLVLIGCLLLAVFDVRYLAGLVLLSPLYLLHLLSVRSEHGLFTLYYALPWLLPCSVCLAVFVKRAKASAASAGECVLLVALSLAMAAPIQDALGAKGQFWYVARAAVTRPLADIPGMRDYALRARRSFASGTRDGVAEQGNCVSIGISALIPNDVAPEELLRTADDVHRCRTLLLMRGDMQYEAFSARAESDGLRPLASKGNVELWIFSGPS